MQNVVKALEILQEQQAENGNAMAAELTVSED